jgi:hypothetical protein
MPAHQKLSCAVCPNARRFTLADDGMSGQIYPIFIGQRPVALYVVTFHSDLTQVVQETGNSERSTIMSGEMKELGNFISNGSNPTGVGMVVTFKAVRGL